MPVCVAPFVAAVQRKGQNAATYLLRDEFTTARADGSVNGTAAEPGPGTRAVATANGGTVAIAGDDLQLVGGATSYNDANFSLTPSFARAAGVLVLITDLEVSNVDAAYIGVDGDQSVQYDDSCWNMSGNRLRPQAIDTDGLSGGTHTVAIVLRATGAWYLRKNGADWDVLWVTGVGGDNPLYVGATQYAASPMDIGGIRVAQLGAPWNASDTGIATQVLAGARAPGDTFTHEGNCLIEFTVGTVPAALQIELRFRVQDATNYWQVTIDSAGNLDLDEVVAGVVTQRGTAADVITNGDRIVIVADGTTIKVYEANTLRIAYAAAANFATETDGELETEGTGGAVTEIISWPRTLSGAALAELEKYTT